MALDITFLGHAGFLLGDGENPVVIDPFLTGNPVAKHKPDEIECKTVLLTHGHEDHVGDAFDIARKNGASLAASHEVTLVDEAQGHDVIGVNPGGKVAFDWGWAAWTQAFHSSSHSGRYMGAACGIVLNLGGVTLYN